MVRGSGRGRGMPGRGGMGRPPFNRPRVLMLRPPFDLILAEPAFPRCKPVPDDSALTQVKNCCYSLFIGLPKSPS